MEKVFVDQLKRDVRIQFPPKRIISLAPSQTELLYELGLGKEVVGITKFCIHPEKWHMEKVKVGGTKLLHLDSITDLKPDLIIANKEENKQEQIEELSKKYPVWVSDIRTLEDAMEMILAVGEIVDRIDKAVELTKKIQARFEMIKPIEHPLKIAYLIWKDPYMAVGGDNFINDVLRRCGLNNVFENLYSSQTGKNRYVKITKKELFTAFTDVVFLSSEPYPFKEKHIVAINEISPTAEAVLVDGEMFSWYGSRLLETPGYIRELMDKLKILQRV